MAGFVCLKKPEAIEITPSKIFIKYIISDDNLGKKINRFCEMCES